MTLQPGSALRAGLPWMLFGVFSLAAVLTGGWAAGARGAPAQAWMSNIIAWSVGSSLAAGIARLEADAAPVWLALAAAVLTFTLFAPGLSGVHRWIGVGPVRLNGAELLLPVALAACAGLDRPSLPRLLAPLLFMIILVAQPDLSQVAATAAATFVLLITSSRPLAVRALVAFGSVAAVVAASLRPAPLSPVPEVEGIVGLAAAMSPALACLGLAAIAGTVLTPLILARAPASRVRDAAFGLAAYLALAAMAPVAGAFPVPLMGIGVSPIIGAWLGIGWLMHLARQSERGTDMD